MMKFDTEVAGFVIACYISDLERWSGEGYAENLADALKLADDLDVRERVYHQLSELCWESPTQYVATFYPQEWQRHHAVEVHPQGDVQWDCTEAFLALDPAYRETLLNEMKENAGIYDSEALDASDSLKDDPNAPEWIRNWTGPFDIYVGRVE